MKKTTLAAALAAAALLLAGCSTSPEEAAEDTAADNAAACASLAALDASLDTAAAGAVDAATTSESVTVGEAEAALADISTQWEAAADDLDNLSDSVREQFDQAGQAYTDALNEIDEGDTLASAKAQVETAQQNLVDAYNEVLSDLGC